MSRTRILATAIVGLLVVFFLYVSCTRAGAATIEEPPYREPKTFTTRGHALSDTARLRTRVGTCWHWENTWKIVLVDNRLAYAPGMDLLWCANRRGTKVISTRWSNICFNGGGFYRYNGCDKQRSAFGYPSVRVVNNWHYSFSMYVYTIQRNPQVDLRVYPDGRVSGTIYWQ